jgi:cell division protein FtsQ
VRFRRRRLVALAVVAAVASSGAGWALVYSSVLASVEGVEVRGAVTVSVADVLAAAAVPLGGPLAGVDTGAVAARVAALPGVGAVEVGRDWPHTVVVAVTERVPVAVAPTAQGPFLVDGAGVAYHPAPLDPDLPRLTTATVGPDDPATRAALAVLAVLPEPVRDEVRTVRVLTHGTPQVTLELTEDRVVRWGSPDRAAEKAAVLAPLLTERGQVYDVASPELPTVRR